MADTDVVRGRVRGLIDDRVDPPSKIVRLENLRRGVNGDQVNGANKRFVLNNRNLVPAATYAITFLSDGVAVVPANFTQDDLTGIVTLAAAQAAPAVSAQATYAFSYLTDDEVEEHITGGLDFVGQTDVANMAEDGLLKALIHEAAALAAEQLAARAATLIDASAGGKAINKKSIKDHYVTLAEYYHKKAVEDREMFYKRQGKREAPAFGQFSTKQRVYTPKR